MYREWKKIRFPKRVLYMNLGTTRLTGRSRNRWQDEVRADGRSSWERQGIVAFCTRQWNEWIIERKHAVILCTFFLFRLPLQHRHQNLGHPLQSIQAVVALEVNFSIRNMRNLLGSSNCHNNQAVPLLCLQWHLPLHPNQCQHVYVQLPLCLHHCQHIHLYLRPL